MQPGAAAQVPARAPHAPAGAARLLAGLRAGGAPAVVVGAAVAWSLARGIDHRFLSFSDGLYMYVASVVATKGPHILYGHVALSQPPGGILGTALLWKLSPHVETVRIALAACGLLTVLLAYRVGRMLFGLTPSAAAIASVIALTGPIHAQFAGADPEVLLAPLALGLALTLERRRAATAGLLMGLGLFLKITWAPFLVAGAAALAVRDGGRAAVRAVLACGLVAGGLYATGIGAFHWNVHDLVTQLVRAESNSGLQLDLVPVLVIVTLALWWPLLVLAPAGISAASGSTRYLMAAGAFSGIFMVKQGTFFNELDPLEPLLALAAVAGAVQLWHRRQRVAQGVVIVCALGLFAHTASLTGSTLSRALPAPLGAAVLDLDNERSVDLAAATIRNHSRPGQAVLVNPLLALVAHRREPGDQADWFILHALGRTCTGQAGGLCGEWVKMKRLARDGHLPVVGIDKNVVTFDRSFRADTGIARLHQVLKISKPPFETSLYAR